MHMSRNTIWNLKALVLLGGLVLAVFLLSGGARDHVAVAEAQFSDESPSGLALIPASGASQTSYTGTYTGSYTGSYSVPSCLYPLEGGWDAYGRILYAGYANRYLSVPGYGLRCFTNPTGNTFFVPAATAAETNSFVSAGPGLGVYVR